MTEEVIQEQEVQSPQDPLSELAQQYGWNPDKGDKSPREFIEYAMQNLEPRGKELKEVKQNLSTIQANIDMLVQEKYEKRLQELEHRKMQAIESGDVQEVDRIYEERQKLSAPKGMPTSVEVFTQKYGSVIEDSSLEAFEIREFIVKRDSDLAKRNLSADEHTAILERDMLKKFPTYFNQGTPIATATPVNASTGGTSKKEVTLESLTKEQRNAAEFAMSRGMPLKAYIDGLKSNGLI